MHRRILAAILTTLPVLVLALAVLFAGVPPASGASGIAVHETRGFAPAGGVQLAAAAPAAQAGGTFTVNSTSDMDSADTELTLREAIALANGGTDGPGGLGRGLSNVERGLIGGCQWTGGAGDWHNTAGTCGAGVTDTIVFNLPPLSVITLNSALPAINDTVRTLVNGGVSTVPVIDASGAGGDGLLIASANNVVMHLAVEKAPAHNFRVTGSGNQLVAVYSTYGGQDGITLSGDSNIVDGASVGVALVFGGCAGAAGYGIRISGGTQYNTVENSTISCNAGGGIAVVNYNGSGGHTLGPNNVIGSASSAAYANGNFGVALSSNSNSVLSSTIGLNNGDGIAIYRGFNSLMGNTVISNTGSGVLLYGLAQNNYIGCGVLCFSVSGNRLSANMRYGVEITGTGVSFNSLAGNQIGLNPSNHVAEGNVKGGVLVDGADDTTIGGAGARLNNIAGNHGSGVTLDHGAYNTTLSNDCIGWYCLSGAGAMPNTGFGVLLQNGAHDNTIGVSGSGLGNRISWNEAEGVLIGGAGSAHNAVNNNDISANGVAGVLVGSGAHDNVIGADIASRNTIAYNTGDGVIFTAGAYSNTLGYNYVGTDSSHDSNGNSGNGVSILNGAHDNFIGQSDPQYTNEIQYNGLSGIAVDGSATAHNVILRNRLYLNNQDGIRLSNGANNNVLGLDTYNELNSVYSNGLSGLSLQDGAYGNAIYFNAFDNNNRHGIILSGTNTSRNVISTTMIHDNALDGINEGSGASENIWTQLSVYRNGGLGIDKNALDDANNTITPPLPVITSVKVAGGVVTVTGSASPGNTLFQTVTVELYDAAPDPSGFGEGKSYLQSAVASAQGVWQLTFSGTSAGCYTAFQTIYNSIQDTSTSSEFGPNSCRVFLPLIRR